MLGVVFTGTSVANFCQQWEYALSHFKPDLLFRASRIEPSPSRVLDAAVPISGAHELPVAVPLVLLAPPNGMNLQGDVSLFDFEHPADAIYWFGSDAHHLEDEPFAKRAPDHRVFIPTDTKDQMYSFGAYLVTAWDRRLRGHHR